MSKSYNLFISILIIVVMGCASTHKEDFTNDHFKAAKSAFDSQFPRIWPPKKLGATLNHNQKSALENMVIAVEKILKQSKIKFSRIGSFEIAIEATGNTFLNKQAKLLQDDGITIEYDALYFARSPFSAGTFDSKSRKLLISHLVLDNKSSLTSLIDHELVHVTTFRNETDKKPSPFYCKFKGKQFEPHYLACDEMNAYNLDLKTLMSSNANPEMIKSKVQAARMHTDPIPILIENLNISSAKREKGAIVIQGVNREGAFRMEFPEFVLVNAKGKLLDRINEHLIEVKAVAVRFISYISSVESRD